MNSIQKADPKARRRTMVLLGTVGVAGLIAIATLESFKAEFEAWLERNFPSWLENPIAPAGVVLLFVTPIFGAGIYLFILGGRTVRAQRFPPPGQVVVRDTPVSSGAKAVWRGRLLQALSVVLICAAGAIPVFVWYLFTFLGK